MIPLGDSSFAYYLSRNGALHFRLIHGLVTREKGSSRHEALNWRAPWEGVGGFLHSKIVFHTSTPSLLALVLMDS